MLLFFILFFVYVYICIVIGYICILYYYYYILLYHHYVANIIPGDDSDFGRTSHVDKLVRCIICEPPYNEIMVARQRSLHHNIQKYQESMNIGNPTHLLV
jgi:hypothetical protein